MKEFDLFCNKINSVPYECINNIFSTSKLENTFNSSIVMSVGNIINNNIQITDNTTCIDFFCGAGALAGNIGQVFNVRTIGIDINFFNEWKLFPNTKFYQKDVFSVLKVTPDFVFDIIVTFNTLRASEAHWKSLYTDFLSWCELHGKYLITNNCTNKQLPGFEIIDTVKVPNFYDTNLFKNNSI